MYSNLRFLHHPCIYYYRLITSPPRWTDTFFEVRNIVSFYVPNFQKINPNIPDVFDRLNVYYDLAEVRIKEVLYLKKSTLNCLSLKTVWSI
jgi:hypothetical protein